MLSKISDSKAYPLAGGCITERDKTQLPLGSFSWAQNVRGDHPGIRQRKGLSQLHTTTLTGAPAIVTLYQYKSVRGAFQKLFAQTSTDDLWVQDTDNVKIPDQYSGAFGASSHTGGSGTIPASYSNVKDHLVYSNGVDQHQVYCGPGSLIEKFVVFDGAAAPGPIPDNGRDYTDQIRDKSNTARVAVLDGLDTYANFECIFIMSKVPCNSLTWVIGAANGNASVSSMYYWNGSAWAATSDFSDGTASGGATLATSGGAMTWTSPGTAEEERYQYGANGFWYQIRVSAQLDAEVEVSSVTFDDSGFQPLRNIWDAEPVPAIEVQVYTAATGSYYTYGSQAVDLSSSPSTFIYIASPDKIEGLYIDPGTTPNLGAANTNAVWYWDGTQWVTAGAFADGTSGFENPGWITFPRQDAHPREFNTSRYQAYWYALSTSATMGDDVIIAVSCMPYFDIQDFGKAGFTNCAWKDRACYSSNLYGPNIYVAKRGRPMMLNGRDYGILVAGDGRYNPIKAKAKFVNELMVWQEEIGHEGGCVTIFEGYTPATFGKLVLSSKIGTMNAKTVAVVDGVITSTRTEERLKTIAFFLSRYGVCATDGRTISIISDDIQNYFDPKNDECININHKDKMWLSYDSSEGVVRIGLVTGVPRTTSITTSTTADKLVDTEAAFTTDGTCVGDQIYNTTDDTTALVTAIDSDSTLSINSDIMTSGEGYKVLASSPNTFPVFDLIDKSWSFDTPAQNLLCMAEISADPTAAESNIASVQVGGGDNDGFIYRLNHGTNDYNGAVETAIDSYIDMEINVDGEYVLLDEMAIRLKAQAAGNLALSFYKNGVLQASKDIAMTAEITGDVARRHRFYLDFKGHSLTIRMQNSTLSQEINLYDIGLGLDIWKGM